MPEYSTFAEWLNSPFYQLFHNTQTSEKVDFINGLIRIVEAPHGSKILETGCGNGVNSKHFAQNGFDVTGIDYSFDAINQAKQLEGENLQFFQHDMRLPFWINYFDYAFNLFTAFGYFNTLREHDNSIRTISQSLKLNGLFVVDFFNVNFEETHLDKTQEIWAGTVEFGVENSQDEENFYKKIRVKEEEIVKDLFTEKHLKLSLGDFTDMFAYQGLQIQEVFGDYNFSDYNVRTSPRLIFIAKKIRR